MWQMTKVKILIVSQLHKEYTTNTNPEEENNCLI